jgi:hypothetical protein
MASSRPRNSSNVWFTVTAAVGAGFVFTVLCLIWAASERARDLPLARWLESWGNTLLVIEVLALLAFGLTAMLVDQARTESERSDPTADAPGVRPHH